MSTVFYTNVMIPPVCSWEDCENKPTMMLVPKADESDGYAVGCGDHYPEIQKRFEEIAADVRQGILDKSIQRVEQEEVLTEDAPAVAPWNA